MHFVLLTWNPGYDDDHIWTPEEWQDAVVRPLLSGEHVELDWSVGRHCNNIEPGDVAFMYRQGEHGRGIVARGIILTTPKQGQHFDGTKGRTTNYVDVHWQEAVTTNMAVEVDELEMLAPDFLWRKVYSSGRQVPPAVGQRIARAWSDYVTSEEARTATALFTSDLWRNYLNADEFAFS